MSKTLVQFTFKLPVEIKHKGQWFIANCPILDVITQGRTEEEAKVNLGEALSLFLMSCYERETLYKVMRDCGFSPAVSGKFQDKKFTEQEYIDVPLPFMIDTQKQSQCHHA